MSVNMWIPWSGEALDIPFESSTPGIGHGEHRVARQIGTMPNGQNSPHDLELAGTAYAALSDRADVKKLDKDNFNTGREGRDRARNVKHKLDELLTILPKFKDHVSVPIRTMIERLEEVTVDELAEKTLQRMEAVCEEIHDFQEALVADLDPISMFDIFTGEKISRSPVEVIRMSKTMGKSEAEIRAHVGDAVYDRVSNISDHPYIKNPPLLRQELNSFVDVFRGMLLVFVDPVKGFYVMTNPEEKLSFMRITRGNPRFRVPSIVVSA